MESTGKCTRNNSKIKREKWLRQTYRKSTAVIVLSVVIALRLLWVWFQERNVLSFASEPGLFPLLCTSARSEMASDVHRGPSMKFISKAFALTLARNSLFVGTSMFAGDFLCQFISSRMETSPLSVPSSSQPDEITQSVHTSSSTMSTASLLGSYLSFSSWDDMRSARMGVTGLFFSGPFSHCWQYLLESVGLGLWQFSIVRSVHVRDHFRSLGLRHYRSFQGVKCVWFYQRWLWMVLLRRCKSQSLSLLWRFCKEKRSPTCNRNCTRMLAQLGWLDSSTGLLWDFSTFASFLGIGVLWLEVLLAWFGTYTYRIKPTNPLFYLHNRQRSIRSFIAVGRYLMHWEQSCWILCLSVSCSALLVKHCTELTS